MAHTGLFSINLVSLISNWITVESCKFDSLYMNKELVELSTKVSKESMKKVKMHTLILTQEDFRIIFTTDS